MLTAIGRLFVAKAPTTNIAGIALTQDEAVWLFETCSVLKLTLDSELHAIHKLPTVPYPEIKNKIRHIQLKHVDTLTYLSSVVFAIQKSTEPWVHEIADAQKALENKAVSINRCSRSIGVIVAALQFWPVIAETCIWLLPLLVRLRSELGTALEGQGSWTADIRLQTRDEWELPTDREQQDPTAIHAEGPHVSFCADVAVREYLVGEEDSGEEAESYCVKLTDDRKRTVRGFKSEKAK